eukprot:CAMPEP_0197311140 /NCGR_PEP_ID=MMETSP0891-20130614/9661_1 /TAXON_ID=44058 ORGANISM="Aureoumbra lagunensis, Strain CCMP1510" /NCGR_SAMPLE_ID=MMETSP0891 /ASSEMBLY_ACC=CAM_ASM_000534 /LENGTH=781 /DNA_ID=CAMNT_0042797113 /DNA_START=453 /DNA_END=2798 /DNA_ORIENTATION=+
MTCSYCGCFFCYACLKRVRSQQEAHAHVPLAHGCDSAYLPRAKLSLAHNQIRQTALLQSLRQCGDEDIAQDLVGSIEKELDDLGMSAHFFYQELFMKKRQDNRTALQQHTMSDKMSIEQSTPPNAQKFLRDNTDESDLLATAGKRVLAAACRGNWTAFRQLATEYGNNNNNSALFEDRDELGRPALQHVIFNSPEPTRDMALAVRLGCRVDQPQEHGWRPLHLAVWKRDVELVKALVDDFAADLDAKIPGDGKTALMLATAADDLETMRCLLDRGADPAAVDDNGRTALAHAFDDDDDDDDDGGEIVNANNDIFPGDDDELGEFDFDDDDDDQHIEDDDLLSEDDTLAENDGLRRNVVSRQQQDENRPLCRQERRLAVTVRKVEVYLQYATPRLWTVRDKLQDTALHQVIKCCHVDSQAKILEMLVDGGAPVDAVGELDWRPLHLAAWFRAHAAVTLLLSRGASVDGRCGPRAGVLNNTPLHLCAGGSATSFKDFLNHSAPHDLGNVFETLVALLSHGANPRATNQRGQTPLQYARDEAVLAGLDRRDRHMLKASHAAVDRILSAPDPLRTAQRALERHYRSQAAPIRRRNTWLAQHLGTSNVGDHREERIVDEYQQRLQDEDDFFLGDNTRSVDEDEIETNIMNADPSNQPEPLEKEEPSDGPHSRVEPPVSESFVSGFFSPRSVLDLAQALARRFDSSRDLRQQEKNCTVEEFSKFRQGETLSENIIADNNTSSPKTPDLQIPDIYQKNSFRNSQPPFAVAAAAVLVAFVGGIFIGKFC